MKLAKDSNCEILMLTLFSSQRQLKIYFERVISGGGIETRNCSGLNLMMNLANMNGGVSSYPLSYMLLYFGIHEKKVSLFPVHTI